MSSWENFDFFDEMAVVECAFAGWPLRDSMCGVRIRSVMRVAKVRIEENLATFAATSEIVQSDWVLERLEVHGF